MSDSHHVRKLQINKANGNGHRIVCSLEMPPGEVLKIQPHQHPSLVMDPAQPTWVGWRWDTPPDAWAEVGESPTDQSSRSSHGGIRLEFAYVLDLTDEVAAFFPPDESVNYTQAKIDYQTRTIWFPLPEGQSIHNLERPLGFEGRNLLYIVEDWISERNDRSPLPFQVDDNVTFYDGQGFCIRCYSETSDTSHCVEIPAELLEDPIKNGSKYLEHGFNPWNEDQKSRIVAHLEL